MLKRVSHRWPVLAVLIGFALLPGTLLGQDGIPAGTELTIPPADRILTLATFWSEAKYNFAFWDRVPDLDWDAAFARYSERALNVQSDIQFFRLAIVAGWIRGGGDQRRLGSRRPNPPRIGGERDRWDPFAAVSRGEGRSLGRGIDSAVPIRHVLDG
jgi:hypothetical protein